nr:DMT family transporter [Propionivibrio sp.]
MSMLLHSNSNPDSAGIVYATASGAITSGLGYAIWYSVVPALKATNAASVQLSVPVIAALGGIIILGESVTTRFVLASLAILGGIALVILSKPQRNTGRNVFPAVVNERRD